VRHPDATQPFPDKLHATCGIVARPEGNQRGRDAAHDMWATKMEKETTPLWVWLSVGLMVIGAVTYVTTVYFIEYIMTFF
jgi:hypothetical protein